MLKKFLLSILLLSIFSIAHAESCLTINDLKHNNLQGWVAYDINEGTALNTNQIKDFEYNARSFALAEYAKDAPEGSAHCYYYHQNPSKSYGIGYLAKKHLTFSDSYAWKNSKGTQCTASDDNCQCQAENDICQFVPAK